MHPVDALTVFATLLQQRTGQIIAASRAWRIETALGPVLRDRGIDTLEHLAARVGADEDPALADHIVDALLNQESSFFRDPAVMELIGAAVQARRIASPTRSVRLWSAGCSTGQEPLSLAMMVAEQTEVGPASGAAGRAPEIVASDVSGAALARARSGMFTQFEIQRGLSVRRMVRWFDAVGSDWMAKPDLVRTIAFRRANLIGDELPVGRFDVILCRNVLMYLSPPRRAEVLARLAGVLRPDGLLVLGAGETVIGQTDAFRPSPTYRGFYEPTGV
ncbi:CheR family methyltransferase [Sphingomonas qilianensis]